MCSISTDDVDFVHQGCATCLSSGLAVPGSTATLSRVYRATAIIMLKKCLWGIGLAALAAGLAFALWQKYVLRDDLSEGLASGNGRIEAEDIDLASKLPGRIKSILVR